MFTIIDSTIKACIKVVSAIFLILLVVPRVSQILAIDVERSALFVAALLAGLVLIKPRITRLAFIERVEAEIKKLDRPS